MSKYWCKVFANDVFDIQILLDADCDTLKVVKDTDQIPLLDAGQPVVLPLVRRSPNTLRCCVNDRIEVVSLAYFQSLPFAYTAFRVPVRDSGLFYLFR